MSWIDELRDLLRRARREAPPEEPGGLQCHEAAERIFEWLDGELDPDLGDRVGAHLETCARCYPRLLFEKAFLEAVGRASRTTEMPASLRTRIETALDEERLRSS